MRRIPPDRHRNFAALVYALLLWLYPRAHRDIFGRQMLQTFGDHYRDAVEARGQSQLWFWCGVVVDEGRSLLQEYRATLARAVGERVGPMKTGESVVLAAVVGLLLLLGLRVWLYPAVLSAPHGGGSAGSSVAGLAIVLVVYALVALGLAHARLRARGPQHGRALRRATLLGAALGGGVLAAIAVDTLGDFESPVGLALWTLIVAAAPIGWGAAGLMVTRAGGSWRLGLVAALWSGMVTALVGAAGELGSTLLALPRLVQHELSNPDYLAWHQPDVPSYAIASALALGMIGLILAPVVAGLVGSIGSGLGRAGVAAVLHEQANLE
jgi:hypothetical protein